jgi:FKBP-type peptidyl-prolyl cis-trans isomerase
VEAERQEARLRLLRISESFIIHHAERLVTSRGKSMRVWQIGILGCLGWAVVGCEEPEQIVPVTPPGAVIPRIPPDKDDPAQAQGESIATAPKSAGEIIKKSAPPPLATPTAKGETKTTKNGVKYETLREGTGDEIKSGQVARLHYEGKLENGTVFDSSKKGEPFKATLGTGQLIKGWEEAVPGMRVGEVRKLTIPPAMAYGDRGTRDGKVPPNSTLIFEVELLGIN